MGWLVAMVLGILFWQAQLQIKKLKHRQQKTQAESKGYQALSDLILLRLECQRLQTLIKESSEIDVEIDNSDLYQYCQNIINKIDQLWMENLASFGAEVEQLLWKERRQIAWHLLQQQSHLSKLNLNYSRPPWVLLESEFQSTPYPLSPVQLELDFERKPQSQILFTPTEAELKPDMIALEVPIESKVGIATVEPDTNVKTEIEPIDNIKPETNQLLDTKVETEIQVHPPKITEPAPPSALEQMMHKVSGWSSLLLPFLQQNIGWFLGGFCFLAGSIFLATYTTGLVSNLVVFLTLFAYTVFLAWAGYQLQKHRPELSTASRVLMILSALLMPLNFTASVRFVALSDSIEAILLSGLSWALSVAVFYYLLMLISGLIDRNLSLLHASLFLLLSGLQIVLPLTHDSLFFLMMAHLVLFVALSYGFLKFSNQWMLQIFVEQKAMTYYAIGSLVYATFVSFIHMTWSSSVTLPQGYPAPFIMLFVGFGFYLDAEFKQWTKQSVFFSKINFLLYGLSVFALLLIWYGKDFQMITLLVGLMVYAMLIWKYLSLVPLYLFLLCSAWLYDLLVLQWLALQWFFISGLPLLLTIVALTRLAEHRRAWAFVQVLSFFNGLSFGLLFGLSLVFSQPSYIAMLTIAIAWFGIWRGLSRVPKFETTIQGVSCEWHNKSQTRWLYIIPVGMALFLAYMPMDSDDKLLVLLITSLLCSYWGAKIYSHHKFLWQTSASVESVESSVVIDKRSEVWLNTALLGFLVVFAWILLLAVQVPNYHAIPIIWALLLMVMAWNLLWLSLVLQVQWFVYAFLVYITPALLVMKWQYFPSSTKSGLGAMLLAILVAVCLVWLQRRSASEVVNNSYPPLTLFAYPLEQNREY